jgi:amino acid permease
LSLPGDFARLGWLPALLIFAWFSLMGVYSGTLYQRLSLRVPGAVVFDEIGRAAMGTPGSAMVYATIYATIFCVPIILHITCIETLRQVSYCSALRVFQNCAEMHEVNSATCFFGWLQLTDKMEIIVMMLPAYQDYS